MSDFFEIDFLSVETKKSGDAIAIRYGLNGNTFIHVVDAGFQATGEKVVQHIREHYVNPTYINHVVVSHPDGDHAGGLRTILEEFDVGTLWMLRPWMYADEIIHRFSTYSSVDHLRRRLRDAYPNLVALEEIATTKGIEIADPFQGAAIGAFTVLAPTKQRYLDLVVESDKTPESVAESEQSVLQKSGARMAQAYEKVVNLIKSAWGAEIFSAEETSNENEMSVVQYVRLCDTRILLTADAGRAALAEAADYAPAVGLVLPGIDRIQVPHHGSRRNVSTEILDRWLGARLPNKPAEGDETFTAIISSAKEDADHPRRAVIRAFAHRGARVIATEGNDICTRKNAPSRGWGPVAPIPYPDDQEDA